MPDADLYRRVMFGTQVWAWPLRGVLRLASAGYGAVIAVRNRRFDHGMGVRVVDVPVISVGNVTVGGTGKTPLVVEVARQLATFGRRVAVVSRGYKAAPGQPADEQVMISRLLPEVACIAEVNRVRAAERAIRERGIDAIVLDDGFQHRRLGRALDIVTIDATCPFGGGHLLPRGLLREPLCSLRRASLIVVTRTDQVPPDELEAIHQRLAQVAPGVTHLDAVHRPSGLVGLGGERIGNAIERGMPVVAFSGIGNPASFERTLCDLDVKLCAALRWGDHHRYEAADLERVAGLARQHSAEIILTTEKDAVKVASVPFDWPAPVRVLRIEIDFLDEGAGILETTLREVL